MTLSISTRWRALFFLYCLVAGIDTACGTEALDRAQQLQHRLRCLVCQNQSIAESNAELANDLRRQIDEQIAAGRTDAEIIAFMTDRYGDFVLYQPPLRPTTILLWTGPALMLVVAGFAFWRVSRRRNHEQASPELTPEERARARRLLDDHTGDFSR